MICVYARGGPGPAGVVGGLYAEVEGAGGGGDDAQRRRVHHTAHAPSFSQATQEFLLIYILLEIGISF